VIPKRDGFAGCEVTAPKSDVCCGCVDTVFDNVAGAVVDAVVDPAPPPDRDPNKFVAGFDCCAVETPKLPKFPPDGREDVVCCPDCAPLVAVLNTFNVG